VNTSTHRVLITGVLGYIGSHLARRLYKEPGLHLQVDGLDNASQGLDNFHAKSYIDRFFEVDVYNDGMIAGLNGRYDTVVHLAGLISVGDSMTSPTEYYLNNVMGTLNVIDWIKPRNLVFASTAACFEPNSPYAYSKLVCEQIIREKCENYTIFRFFNVAGSDGMNRQIGKSTHLVRVAAETAAGKRESMTINGCDYPTPDGTCLRDYVHVEDLVDSIVKSIYNPKNTEYECLANGRTYSCLNVIDAMRRVTGVNFKAVVGDRREGDVAKLSISHNQKSEYFEGKRTLDEMCLSAYKMELK